MNISTPRRSMIAWPAAFIAAAVSGLAFGFAQPGGGFSVLAFFFLPPLFWAFIGRGWLGRAVLGGVAGSVGTAASAGGTAAVALKAYFDPSGPELILAWLAALQILGALPIAVFGMLAGDARRLGSPMSFLWIGACWVTTELLRELIFPGAWLSLSNALTSTPGVLQSASAIGHLGVSFWLAGSGALFFRILLGVDRRRGAMGVILLGAVLAIQANWDWRDSSASGFVSRATTARSSENAIRVALIQSGRDSITETLPESDTSSLAELLELTHAAGKADLVIWPEGAFRSLWPYNHEFLSGLSRSRSASLKYLLFGAPWADERPGEATLGVAAILIDSNTRIRDRHMKARLLPVAEKRDSRLMRDSDESGPKYTEGTSTHPLEIDGARLGVSICYEVLFAEENRSLVSAGADLLVNLSNESWLGAESRGPDQMLAAAILRAIELRRPVLRSTTTGITAAIDADGHVVASLNRSGSAHLLVDVVPANETSGFTRYGHLPVFVIVGSILIARAARTAMAQLS